MNMNDERKRRITAVETISLRKLDMASSEERKAKAEQSRNNQLPNVYFNTDHRDMKGRFVL